MNRISLFLSIVVAFGVSASALMAQQYTVSSPDNHISLSVNNEAAGLSYAVSLDGRQLIAPSPMGFEFKGEATMQGNFEVKNPAAVHSGIESWTPVVRNKHAQCNVPYNELTLQLKEKSDGYRRMDVTFRVMNDGVAFRYTLYGVPVLGNRQVTRELTGYAVPEESSLWIPDFAYEDEGHSYKSSQEGNFIKTPVRDIKSDIHAGLPGLIEVDTDNWMAITEADLDNFPAFYLGRSEAPAGGYQMLQTKLTPIWGEPEEGVKARFSEEVSTSWRVIMVGHNPGHFIESEIIRSLNPDCVLTDTDWIRPGLCAWDHWWSGEVKMEQDVIKQYIDLAATEGWPLSLIHI